MHWKTIFNLYLLFVYSAQRRIPSGAERHESGSGTDGADGVQSTERSSGSNGRLEERQRRRTHRFDDKVHSIISNYLQQSDSKSTLKNT